MNSTDVRGEGVQLVILGSFNPAIVSAGWLQANDLISSADADVAEVLPSPGRASLFTTGWFQWAVYEGRMQLSSDKPAEYERLRDLAVGALKILNHTPVAAMGINRYFQCAVSNNEVWHRIGDTLAPKEFWCKELELPGMKDVTVTSVRPDNYAGEVNVSVQPSQIVTPGVYVSQNDHFVLRTTEHQPSDRREFFDEDVIESNKIPAPDSKYLPVAIEILTHSWANSMVRAERLVDHVLRAGEP
jgi:hypothetical protein